jgi:phosphoribosylformylglycinamidine synthase
MIGVVEDVDHITTLGFKREGDAILLLGRNTDELGGSEYLKVVHGLVAGDAPRLDLAFEKALQTALLEAIRMGRVASAHDTAEGGLAVALAESAFADRASPFGIDVELQDDLPITPLLFGEAQSRVVISCDPTDVEALLRHFAAAGVEARQIGRVGAIGGSVRIVAREGALDVPIERLAEIYHLAIPRRMDRTPVDVATSLDSEVYVP